MTTYHINGKGVPSICRAVKGRCPFGNSDSHYDSKEEAQKAADKQMEQEFGIIHKKTGGNEPPFAREDKVKLLKLMVVSSLIKTDERGYFVNSKEKEAYNYLENNKEIFEKFESLTDPNSKISEEQTESELRESISKVYSPTVENKERINSAVKSVLAMKSALKEGTSEKEVRERLENHYIEEGYQAALGDKKPSKSLTPSQMEHAKKMAEHYITMRKLGSKEKDYKAYLRMASFFDRPVKRGDVTPETREIAHKLAKEYHRNKALNEALSIGEGNFSRISDKVQNKIEEFFTQK